MLDELVKRYGEDAIVTARPHMLDDGKTYRWELQIDGTDVPDADAQARRHTERRGWMVMVLVHGDEEVELNRWSTKTYKYCPAAVIRRLGDLR